MGIMSMCKRMEVESFRLHIHTVSWNRILKKVYKEKGRSGNSFKGRGIIELEAKVLEYRNENTVASSMSICSSSWGPSKKKDVVYKNKLDIKTTRPPSLTARERDWNRKPTKRKRKCKRKSIVMRGAINIMERKEE